MSTRRERRAELRRKRRDRGDRRERGGGGSNWFTLLAVAVIVGGIGFAGFASAQALGLFEPAPGGTAIDPRAYQTTGPVGQKMPDQGNTHVSEAERQTGYNSTPPTSGPHWPTPTRWGVYRTQQSDEANVHALEHGGIVISYRGIPEEDVQKLVSLRSRYPRDQYGSVKIIIQPYDDRLPEGTIALTAWTWIDTMEGYDEQRILRFLAAHMNQCCEPVP